MGLTFGFVLNVGKRVHLLERLGVEDSAHGDLFRSERWGARSSYAVFLAAGCTLALYLLYLLSGVQHTEHFLRYIHPFTCFLPVRSSPLPLPLHIHTTTTHSPALDTHCPHIDPPPIRAAAPLLSSRSHVAPSIQMIPRCRAPIDIPSYSTQSSLLMSKAAARNTDRGDPEFGSNLKKSNKLLSYSRQE